MYRALHDGVPALAADLTGMITERLPSAAAAAGEGTLSLADTVKFLFTQELNCIPTPGF